MKLKLDENLSRHLKQPLRSLRHDVATAAEEGLLSQPDVAVAAAAKAEERILLTLELEFGDLRKFPPGSHPGIVLFRPRSFGPLEVNRVVSEFIGSVDLNQLSKCVVIVEPLRVRIRRAPLDLDSDDWKEIPF